MNGIINVLKPPGMTSHDVVNYIRKVLNIKKVGHTGTLDPEAAGVLPICIGSSTKAVQYITDKDKIYRAYIKFGISTDTFDIYGKSIKSTYVDFIDIENLESVISSFIGDIVQKPPIYSAIKYNGKKLYEYALQNEEVDIKTRNVSIYDIKIIERLSKDEFIIDIYCSKGTYIRSLCNDIGEIIGCGACMSKLIRIESSPFNIRDSFTLEEIQNNKINNTIEKVILSVETIFKNYKRITIKDTALSALINGNFVYGQGFIENLEDLDINKKIAVYNDNSFIGIADVLYSDVDKKMYIKRNTIFI